MPDCKIESVKLAERFNGRILTSQGSNISGGKFDYVINGNMIACFVLIASPIRYGETGVNTFLGNANANANGIVCQARLGKNTDTIAPITLRMETRCKSVGVKMKSQSSLCLILLPFGPTRRLLLIDEILIE